MLSQHSDMVDPVAWVNRVNARWIVHHDLNRNAAAYLAHLGRVDPARHEASCRNAYLMAHQVAIEDPKPWFYAGLFSLATPAEAARFLAAHWLTQMVTDRSGPDASPEPAHVSAATRQKIERIQAALAKLSATPDSR